MPVDMIALVPVYIRREHRYVGRYGFPHQFQVAVSNDREFVDKTVVLDSSKEHVEDTGNYPLLIPVEGVAARYVRITCKQLASDGNHWFFALGELVVISGNRNVALWRPVAASGTVEADLRWSLTYLVDAISALPNHTGTIESETDGYLSAPRENPNEEAWLEVDLGATYPVEEVRLFPARPRDRPDVPGWGFPLRFKLELLSASEEGSPVSLFDSSRYDLRHWLHSPLVVPVSSREFFSDAGISLAGPEASSRMPAAPVEARYVRLTAMRLDSRIAPSYLALAEVQVYSRSQNVALGKRVTVRDSAAAELGARWAAEGVNDGFTSRRQLLELPAWLTLIDERRRIEKRLQYARAELTSSIDVVRTWTVRISGSLVFLASITFAVIVVRMRKRHQAQTESLRTQIANDLHDDIGSNLGTIFLLCETFAKEDLDEDQRTRLSEIHEIAAETGDAMRDMVWIMQPGSTYLDEFVTRLRHTAIRMLPDQHIEFDTPAAVPRWVVSLRWRRNVFLAVKELIHNAAKHAGASVVRLTIRVVSRTLRVTISDDGIGLRHAVPGSGFGLASVRGRVEDLNGTLDIDAPPSEGTSIRIQVPFR